MTLRAVKRDNNAPSSQKTSPFSSNPIKIFDSVSSKPAIRYLVYASSIIFFFALILIPPIIGIFLKWNAMGQIFGDPNLMSRASSAIYASFAIALFVSTIDVVAGLPMAWFIARGKSKWLSVLDTFVDIPFIIPTVTLGYSLLLFWSRPGGVSSLFGASLVSPGWLLVMLLHFAFSYPVVVRVMVGAILDYEQVYEEAARTSGAAPFTAARTVTLPILKLGLVASFILAFARSISETGATMMVAGAFENGPVFIKNAKDLGYEGPLVFVSGVLILISCIIFAAIRLLGTRLKLPVKRIWPLTERKLSAGRAVAVRDGLSLPIFLILVLIPSLFVALPAIFAIISDAFSQALLGVGIWQGYWQSLALSYMVGFAVTALNIVAGLPMAVLIARRRVGAIPSTILDVLVNVPLIVPSIALGASLSFFWRSFAVIPELWLLVFAHLSITYPYLVRTMAAAIEGINAELEDAARTLGGRPFTVFRTITLPLTKYSLFAGAIIMFTRSVDETGATLAVVTRLKTAPVLLVDWVKVEGLATPLEIALGCGFLVVLSFLVLLILRLFVRERVFMRVRHQHA